MGLKSDSLRPSSASRNASPLWNRALERYREDLDDDDENEILIGARSLDDLVNYARTIEPATGSKTLTSLHRLRPVLKFVDDFSAVVALCFGADPKLTAFVWGSLRLIITLASSAGDSLQDALDMLEELSWTLPRFRQYEETLPVEKPLENALVDVYTEIICFYARLIRFFKANPHANMRRTAWPDFRGDFTKTVQRVKYLSIAVEKEADQARMRLQQEQYGEVLGLLNDLKVSKNSDNAVEKCYHIPMASNPRFRGRDEDIKIISTTLDPGEEPNGLRSLALYGMGGVGKTQVALNYSLSRRNLFDTIIWLASETSMSLEQSLKDAAQSLKLTHNGTDKAEGVPASLGVKNWLNDDTHGRHWLLVFDNADDIEVIRYMWPANASGSVLITSRDFTTAHNLASTGHHLKPFDDTAGTEMLLQLTGLQQSAELNKTAATEINRILGGLPLALDQIAGFITQRKLRLQDFLTLYKRNSDKIDARKTGFSDYRHTISTVWEMALTNLSGPSLHLQKLLAFLEPDVIHEDLLLQGSTLIEDEDLEFLNDEMDLGDAEEVLLQAALINKNAEERAISVHRLIQSTVFRRLDDSEKGKYFDATVKLLNWGFPDTWSKDIGHQKRGWKKCEMCLPHVNWLVTLVSNQEFPFENPNDWAELLLRCSWYLYEKEQYEYAHTFVSTALSHFVDKHSLAYANAIDLDGLIDLDMYKPSDALSAFSTALNIRKTLLKENDPLIAFSLNNLALAYTEIPDLEKALEMHNKAIHIRLENNSDRIGNSYSNLAVLQLRMENPDMAEETLMKCPSLQNCTDDTFLKADNPRFVGDMVLLSRIRRAQGRSSDALRLASKALAWRQKVHGDGFKTCDSLYDVASLLYEQGHLASASELLEQLIAIAETLYGAEGHLARAYYKLSVVASVTQRDSEAFAHKEKAVALRAKLRPGDKDVPFEEAEFAKLNLFMLW